MKRSTKQWISLTALAAVLAVGCAAQPPGAARPEANQNQVGSTTGDLDACAVALGNAVSQATGVGPGAMGTGATGVRAGAAGTPTGGVGAQAGGVGDAGIAGRMEATANGVLIGNVALVALPAMDDQPMSPPATPTPGADTGAGAAAPGAPGAGAVGAGIAGAGRDLAQGTVGAGRELAEGTVGAGRNLAQGAPGAAGRDLAQGAVGAGRDLAQGAAEAVTPGPVDGAQPGNAVAPGAAAPTDVNDALARIRTACRGVVQIKTVEKPPDRERLAEIAMAVRRGEPVTNFMQDLVGINDRSTITANYAPHPGGAAPGANGPAGAPTPPGTPGGNGTGAPTTP